jgi:ribonuclease P/MRP protein subunit POP3
VVIGLKNVFRRLEVLSQKSKPSQISTGDKNKQETAETQPSTEVDAIKDLGKAKHFSIIFASQSSEILKEHLPQLVATACLAQPELPPTRLVQLSKDFDTKICMALSLPRVSCFGLLENAPHSKALVDLVRQSLPTIEVPWLKEVQKTEYLPVKINPIETSAPVITKQPNLV